MIIALYAGIVILLAEVTGAVIDKIETRFGVTHAPDDEDDY